MWSSLNSHYLVDVQCEYVGFTKYCQKLHLSFAQGIDTRGPPRSGQQPCDDRTLVDEILTPAQVSNYGVSLYALGTLGFLALGHISPAPVQMLAVVYFGGLSASFLYTGGVGLKVHT